MPLPSESLWLAIASVPALVTPALETDTRCDVAIIGGGFTGLSAALHLAECGVSVSLVEADEIGYGASGRNGGHVNPGLKLEEAELVERFGEAGRRFFRLGEETTGFLGDLVRRRNLQCSWKHPGVLRLCHSPAALDAAKAACDRLVRRGVAARLLDRAETERAVGSSRYLGAVLDPRGASVQPLDLARSMASAAIAAGARVYQRSAARSMERVGERWRILCDRGRIDAGQVIVATNGYSDGLVPGLARSLLPVNSFQIATAPLPPDIAATILPGGNAAYDSRRLLLYFRQSPDGRVMLGGRASFSSRRIDSGDKSDYEMLRGVLHGLFPQLRDVPIVHHWTGLVCITPDHLPHYHTPAPGLHVMVGYNGRGVALSTRAGAWLALSLAGKAQEVTIPSTPIKPIPMHAFRAPVLNAVMRWNQLLDAVGR